MMNLGYQMALRVERTKKIQNYLVNKSREFEKQNVFGSERENRRIKKISDSEVSGLVKFIATQCVRGDLWKGL